MVDSEADQPAVRAPAAGLGRLGDAWSRQEALLGDAVIRQNDDAIIVTSAEGIVSFWNQGAERLYGYSADEMVGASIAVLVPAERNGEEQRLLALALAGDPVVQHATLRVRKDGGRVYVSLTVSALRDRNGSLLGVSAITRNVTARVAAKRQLQDRERQLADAQSLAGVGSWEWDLAESTFTLSDELCRLVGWPTGSRLSYEEVVALIHPDDRQHSAPAAGPVQDGSVQVLDYRIIRRDGEVRHVSARRYGRFGEDGELTHVFGTVQDITERQRAEAELRAAVEEAEIMETAFSDAPGGVALMSLDGRFLRVNESLCQIFGRSEQEIVGKTSEGFSHPGDRATTAATYERLRNAGARVRGEKRYVRPDGRVVWASTTATALTGPDGELTHIVAHFREITEQRAAEARLRAAEEQFRRAFDDAPIGMMIIGLDGRYLEVNDAFCAIVGHPRDQLIGLPGRSITHPDDLAQDEEAKRELLTGESKSSVLEKRYINAAGHPVRTSDNVTLIRDAEDRPQHFLTQVQDITERHRYETQLRHMADHDPLTGLLNRRSLERELAAHVARVKRSGATGAVLMVDLDNFKYYNDTQGHTAGDELIVRIGQALQTRLRETDVLVRLGGDEFAALLPNEDRSSAEVVAQDLLELVHREAPAPLHGEARRITASIGIACFADGDLTAEEIMVNADLAMYEAKENGRNRYAHYRTDEHERPRIESQMQWASQITHALAEDRFELLAQPISCLHGDGPTQYELLLRMRDAHGDHIPPGTFLYIAERLGLIQEIDRWVVAHAIDMLAEQLAAGRDLRFEVNLSGHSIGDRQLLELIERRLTETGVPPERLIFEITETAAVANIARAGTFAHRLSELGCRFALDDFGAGFGSFYYLKHLPCDYLKIDGEFVRHCATNSTDRTLISAVVQIARGMGKQTIAEFVGDQDTVEILTDIGVDYGQGYFLGRPAPLAEHLAARAPMQPSER